MFLSECSSSGRSLVSWHFTDEEQLRGVRDVKVTCVTHTGLVCGVASRSQAHSEHRFPAPFSKEGCRKPVLGVWLTGCQLYKMAAVTAMLSLLSNFTSRNNTVRRRSKGNLFLIPFLSPGLHRLRSHVRTPLRCVLSLIHI